MHHTIDIENAIVHLYNSAYEISYSRPWMTSNGTFDSLGTGFSILLPNFLSSPDDKLNEGKFIITNAHCVKNSLNLTIEKQNTRTPFKAKVIRIIEFLDLALLTIDYDYYKRHFPEMIITKITNFWKDMTYIEFNEKIPNKLDNVYIYGFPLRGNNVSISSGVINRISIADYNEGIEGVVIQTDAALNSGNSGGPAVDTVGRLVGIAFSAEDQLYSENIGYLIPVVNVKYFLSIVVNNIDIKTICSLGIEFQEANFIIREYLNIDQEINGVVISSVDKNSCSAGHLKDLDFITKVDGYKILESGMLEYYLAKDFSLSLDQYISYKLPGDNVQIDLIRGGKYKTVNYKVSDLFRYYEDVGMEHRYVIIAGMVFLVCSVRLLKEKRANREEVYDILFSELKKKPDEETIILSEIFPNPLNEGYSTVNVVLESINNIEIKNLRHLYEVYRSELKTAKYLVFKLKDSYVILNSKDVKKYERRYFLSTFGNIRDHVF